MEAARGPHAAENDRFCHKGLRDQKRTQNVDHGTVEIRRNSEEYESEDDDYSVALDGIKKALHGSRHKSGKNAGAVEWRNGNQVEYPQNDIQCDAVKCQNDQRDNDSAVIRKVSRCDITNDFGRFW